MGNSEFCFHRISMFPWTSSRETLSFSGNKIHCSPRDYSLSVYYYPSPQAGLGVRRKLRCTFFRPETRAKTNQSRTGITSFPGSLFFPPLKMNVKQLRRQNIIFCVGYQTTLLQENIKCAIRNARNKNRGANLATKASINR